MARVVVILPIEWTFSSTEACPATPITPLTRMMSEIAILRQLTCEFGSVNSPMQLETSP